jgi:hypothetical protein
MCKFMLDLGLGGTALVSRSLGCDRWIKVVRREQSVTVSPRKLQARKETGWTLGTSYLYVE